ncbi:TolB family protein [Streptomyces sp. NRRL B-24484]|uniref:TolB family protein n=1 Tax=Streptomyces sp. NRRL B-24484 TaxID=1463833 RepID=UPI000D1170E1|nr:PD40 domain-containing protein [Streptomyces sp. NRRL B-24484]
MTETIHVLCRTRPTVRLAAGALTALALLPGCAADPPPRPEGAPSPLYGGSGTNGLIAGRTYLDSEKQTSAVFTVAPDGSGLHQVTKPDPNTLDDHPDWSPGGTAIAFDRTIANGTARIWTIAPDGSAARQLPAVCQEGDPSCAVEDESAPAYSPDGSRIAFSRGWGALDTSADQIQYSDIYVMDATGANPRRLTTLTQDQPYAGDVDDPAWSPDGSRLVFSFRTGDSGRPSDSRALFIVNGDGSGLRQLTPWDLGAGDRANWSPDGSRIVFTTYPPGPDAAPGGGIYTINPDGSGTTTLLSGSPDVFYGVPSYAPDGTAIAFAKATLPGQADIFTMHPDGTAVTPVTRTADTWESRPNWGTATP